MLHRIFLPLLLACALSGCASVPESLQGEEYAQVPLPDAVTPSQEDQQVRWGGLLVATPRVGDDENCLELFARPLDSSLRPDWGRPMAGFFLACHSGQLDSEEFVPGRDVTVVGTFEGFIEGLVEDGVVRFPLVRIGSAHAWPRSARMQNGPSSGQQGGRYPSGAYPSDAAFNERRERAAAASAIRRGNR